MENVIYSPVKFNCQAPPSEFIIAGAVGSSLSKTEMAFKHGDGIDDLTSSSLTSASCHIEPFGVLLRAETLTLG